jgi:hypothetical protein
VTGDVRGWRVALVPESLINPPPAAGGRRFDALGLLEASGYGVLQLPPAGDHRLLLAVIADQIAEYAHHGYAVVAVGVGDEPGQGLHWRRLAPLLRRRGVALPLRHIVRWDGDLEVQAQRLAAFLEGYDLPLEEQRRWRG